MESLNGRRVAKCFLCFSAFYGTLQHQGPMDWCWQTPSSGSSVNFELRRGSEPREPGVGRPSAYMVRAGRQKGLSDELGASGRRELGFPGVRISARET